MNVDGILGWSVLVIVGAGDSRGILDEVDSDIGDKLGEWVEL